MGYKCLLAIEPVDIEEREEQERAKLMDFPQSAFFGLAFKMLRFVFLTYCPLDPGNLFQLDFVC